MDIKQLGDLLVYQDDRFTKKIVFQEDGSVVFVLNFMPGQQLPPHRHPGTQVYLLVLEGAGTMTVDGAETKVGKFSAVRCGGQEEFSFANTGDAPASLYVTLTKIPDERYAKEV